jgi:N-methylhydantoinase A
MARVHSNVLAFAGCKEGERMVWFIGVDVGGTFTDFYAFSDADEGGDGGRERVHKTPSTPGNPARAILDGLDALCRAEGIAPSEIGRLGHGTTVATNALIQRRGAAVALVTTAGFRDLLEIGRQIRPRMYDLKADYPPPLAPRERRFEIAERIGPRGEVVTPLAEDAIAAAVEQVRAAGVEACAVCLLFGFLNPDHERRIGAALRAAMPDLHLSLSSDVQPEFREYERFSTTVQNAYLQPVLSRYMRDLQAGLAARAPHALIGINQSSGGLMSVERAGDYPIRTALSGPAAGAVGAVHVARLAERPDVITLDMGGTSADVCLIRGYRAGINNEQEVAGFPVRLPMVDLNPVGAGGGSFAWLDRDGLLKVGPESAGADPGPACYGRGGERPTVSDANLVLGRLSPRGLLGGAMALDADAARRAVAPVAERLGFTVEKTAQGVVGIVVANMVRAIRAVSVERGHDPRRFSLLAMGGAGPLHAVDVARALGMREVIVPPAPGILCAQGLVVSDRKEDFVVSGRYPVAPDVRAPVAAAIEALAAEARAWALASAADAIGHAVELSLDMRYVGQNFELRVPLGQSEGAGSVPVLPDADALRRQFFAAHEQSYGFHNPEDAVEIINIRLTAHGRLRQPRAVPALPGPASSPPAVETRAVWFSAEESVATPVYDRAALRAGNAIDGPAVIDQLDATTLVFPGDRARVDGHANLLLELAP